MTHELDRFLDEFPETGLGHDPILNKTEYVLMKFSWMSFPGIGQSHTLSGNFAV